jgi:hypothetical protein
MGLTDQEYVAYVAAMLCGLFLGGFLGEIVWQARNLGSLDELALANYATNLRRTIIIPGIRTKRSSGK